MKNKIIINIFKVVVAVVSALATLQVQNKKIPKVS